MNRYSFFFNYKGVLFESAFFPWLICSKSDESRKIDHKPESLVYIEDSETQALVNFLLNSNLCTSKIGPMAGIPPTLLAPTAFLGGTLQSLKV